jgi:hypothetical protein
MSERWALLLGLSIGAACGGTAVVIPPDDGGGSDASSGGFDATGGGDGARGDGTSGDDAGRPPADAGRVETGVDATLDCKDFYAKLTELKTQAKQCCPACPVVQCTQTANDGCCTITVNDANKGAELTKLVEQYMIKCPLACPDILCPPAPSNTCEPTSGMCR